MKDFGVNGIQCIVNTLFKSQQEEMVEHASEIEAAVGHQQRFIHHQRRDQQLNLANILIARRCLTLPIRINCVGLKFSLQQ
jgi:dihydrodipicolinate synthase/N-acetylneuraminate lyase